jgi:HK97 family phage portal protein
MKLGPFEITLSPKKKSYDQLSAMIRREQGGEYVNLKQQPRIQLAEYKSWAYSCVSLISDRVSTLPFSFYRKSTGEELSRTSKGYSSYTKPFYHPNDLMTFRFIKAFCQIQLDMCGMAVLWKGMNKLGQVWEIWPLNMNDFVKCKVSEELINPKVVYEFKFGAGRSMDFDINELIVINYIHPTNPFIGASPIQAQAYAQDIDSYIEVYERDFFKNSARIDFVLSTDESLDQEKADEIKERWKSKYQGTFHDIAVLDTGLKPVPLQYANRDFEFLSLAQWTREKVFAAYRVPKNKLGFAEGNRSGDVQNDISFNRESIQPRLTLWDEELTQGILSSFSNDIEFKHQNPIPRDRLIEVQEGRIHVGLPTLTINEFREKTHKLEAVEGGERIFISKDMIPLDRVDEIIDSQLSAQQAIAEGDDDETGTDPEDDDRDDEPDSHVNPDGSDDRDDNPTDGRSLSNGNFKFLCDEVRGIVFGYIEENISAADPENIDKILKATFADITVGMVVHMLEYLGEKTISAETIDIEDWITPTVDKVVDEYKNTLFKNPKWKDQEWKIYFVDQLNSNPRLSKITNSLSKACINYAKWLIFRENKSNMLWKINSNECGHKGKLKEMISDDYFQLGKTRIRFPNEILNLSCDCTIVKE